MADAIDQLKSYLERAKRAPARLRPLYSTEGDCLIYYMDERLCHADRISDLVTVYLADDNKEMIGCKIKDIRLTLQKYGSFGVAISRGEVMLGFLFSLVGVRPDGESREIFDTPLARKRIRIPDELVPC